MVGRPLVIKATGTVPPEDVGFPYWFSLDAIPAAVTTTCPADQGEGAQFALGSGGSIVVLSQTQHPNLAGELHDPGRRDAQRAGRAAAVRLHRRRRCGHAGPHLAAAGHQAPRKSLRKAKQRCWRIHKRRARARCLRRVRLRVNQAA